MCVLEEGWGVCYDTITMKRDTREGGAQKQLVRTT